VETPVTLTWESWTALPATEVTTTIHCVATAGAASTPQLKGVHWSELEKLCKPKTSGA